MFAYVLIAFIGEANEALSTARSALESAQG